MVWFHPQYVDEFARGWHTYLPCCNFYLTSSLSVTVSIVWASLYFSTLCIFRWATHIHLIAFVQCGQRKATWKVSVLFGGSGSKTANLQHPFCSGQAIDQCHIPLFLGIVLHHYGISYSTAGLKGFFFGSHLYPTSKTRLNGSSIEEPAVHFSFRTHTLRWRRYPA